MQRVGMARRRRDEVEHDVVARDRRRSRAARRAAALAVARRVGEQRLGAIGIDGLGRLAGEAEHDRPVGRVALAGQGERAEQRRP